jgi:argininosuccinate lyase
MAVPNDIALMTANLPSGYHRDLQLLKEVLFPAIQSLKECLRMTQLMLANISVKENILADEKYKYLFSVEEVNKLVLSGTPFRDAYKKVGLDIEADRYAPGTTVNHTHEGSIGNLNLDQVKAMMQQVVSGFKFDDYRKAIDQLLA